LFRDFQIAGKEFRTVGYSDEFVLLVREESVIQGIINTITEIGWCYGIEMNMEKSKLKRASNQTFQQKIWSTETTAKFGYLNYLSSMITNNAKEFRTVE